MAKRIHIIATLFVYLLVNWIRGFKKYRNSATLSKIWKYIPLYILFIFGIYSIISITISLYKFNNIPDAQNDLLKELKEIKVELEKMNFVFT